MNRVISSPASVKLHLDKLFNRFDKSYLEPDPLAAVNGYKTADDIETACLIAGLFAYGRADLIQRNVSNILEAMESSPAAFCETFKPSQNRSWMKGFSYRFHKREDLVALIKAIGAVRRNHGSLKNVFLTHDDSSEETILPGLTGLAHDLKKYANKSSGMFKNLLPDPAAGGASKRWNLFLRWMVRKDNVDPGPWAESISSSRLVIPLDTHVGRIARMLGLLERKSNDWKAALELTRFLRKLDPNDPVKYDFAICSYGKLGYCVRKIDPEKCDSCEMADICSQAL